MLPKDYDDASRKMMILKLNSEKNESEKLFAIRNKKEFENLEWNTQRKKHECERIKFKQEDKKVLFIPKQTTAITHMWMCWCVYFCGVRKHHNYKYQKENRRKEKQFSQQLIFRAYFDSFLVDSYDWTRGRG